MPRPAGKTAHPVEGAGKRGPHPGGAGGRELLKQARSADIADPLGGLGERSKGPWMS